MVKYNQKKLAFVDIELTGLDESKHEIIEIATIIYNQEEDRVEREWEKKIAPSHIETADPKALQINGYINNPHLYKSSLRSALIKFNSIARDCIIVGQNIDFDLRFIRRNMELLDIKPSFHRRDKLDLTSLAWWDIKDSEVKGISLANLCDRFKISNAGAHTALIDCKRTFGVYKCLMNKYLMNE